jgi:hypothetical protein
MMQCMHDLKSRINFCLTLASTSLLLITPPCFNITSSLFLLLWHQVPKKLLIIFRRRWRRHWMIIEIWHITRRRRSMRENIEKMIREPCELLLHILNTCGEMPKLICERIHITPNSTNICIQSIKLLHNRLIILFII